LGRFRGTRLPRPEDPGDAKVLSDIERFGFHAKHVRPWHHPEHAAQNAQLAPHPIYDIGLSYTAGLSHTWRHPELAIVTDMDAERAHDILWAAVALIRDEGARFAAGDTSDRVLEFAAVAFGPVSSNRRKELLTFADWVARRKRFDALQILLPDRHGRFPDHPSYAGPPQPLLGS
jgi:hypothetical protein